jgi:hypothetical protein
MHPTKSASLFYALCAIAPIGIWVILISASFTVNGSIVDDIQLLLEYIFTKNPNQKFFIWLTFLPIYLVATSVIYLTPLAHQRVWKIGILVSTVLVFAYSLYLGMYIIVVLLFAIYYSYRCVKMPNPSFKRDA